MLLAYGSTTVDADWHVIENAPANFSRVYCVYGGEVTYTDEKNTAKLQKDHLYIFPSSCPYKMEHNPQNPLCCLFVHVDWFPILVAELISIDLNSAPFLKDLTAAIESAVMIDNEKIIASLIDTLHLYCLENKILSQTDARIAKAITYISEHVGEDVSIEKLSKITGYNKQYFIRLFKKSTGVSPYNYVIHYRLNEAEKLLKSGYTITQIAQKLGYKDLKSLSRAYKAKFGMSPKNWRKNHTLIP